MTSPLIFLMNLHSGNLENLRNTEIGYDTKYAPQNPRPNPVQVLLTQPQRYEDDFKLFGYCPDDALRIAKEKNSPLSTINRGIF